MELQRLARVAQAFDRCYHQQSECRVLRVLCEAPALRLSKGRESRMLAPPPMSAIRNEISVQVAKPVNVLSVPGFTPPHVGQDPVEANMSRRKSGTSGGFEDPL